MSYVLKGEIIMQSGIKKFRTRSGLNFAMDEELYYSVAEKEQTLDKTEWHIMAGEYFPQIMRFAATLILLLYGKFDFVSIFLTNVCVEVISTLIWFALPIYKIPAVSLIFSLIGQTVFRFFIHFIAIGVFSFTIFNDWKIILFSIISGIVASVLNSLIFGYRFSAKRNNDIAKFVLK